MSKYVKDLVTQEIAERTRGVEDALLVNVVGLSAPKAVALRKRLRENGMRLLVVKTSLAKRASQGTPLAAAFEQTQGSLALLWGDLDIISLAKEVVQLEKSGEFAPFAPCGGVMDGEALTAEGVKRISKWPNRQEQLGILAGQILAPGARLASQLLGPGGALASQIDKLGDLSGAADDLSGAAGDSSGAAGESEKPEGAD